MKPEEKFKLVKISTKVDKAQFQEPEKIIEGFRYSDLDTNFTLPVDLAEVNS